MADAYKTATKALAAGVADRDQMEYRRLRLQHRLTKKAMEKLVLVPLNTVNSVRILDNATGDGEWMVDVAATYPKATFIGADIEQKHFKQRTDIPPSVKFVQQSMFDPWPKTWQSSFDFVHQRYVLSMAKEPAAINAIRGLLGLLKRGGYIQLVDCDLRGFLTGEDRPAFTNLANFIIRALTEVGMNPVPGQSLKKWLLQAGARDVEAKEFNIKLGAAEPDKHIRQITIDYMLSTIDTYAEVGRKMGPKYWYTPDDFKRLRSEINEEIRTKGNVWRFVVAVGRRDS